MIEASCISIRAELTAIATLALTAVMLAQPNAATNQAQQQESQERFRFRTGVELINVTATVTDASGRFISGLQEGRLRPL